MIVSDPGSYVVNYEMGHKIYKKNIKGCVSLMMFLVTSQFTPSHLQRVRV